MARFPLNVSKIQLGAFLCLLLLVGQSLAGQLVDKRDGTVYKTVKVGNKVWMAEKLNYKVPRSYCYDGDDCSKFGRYYRWEDAKKICPEGWHLPVQGELVSLLNNGPKFVLNPNGFAMQLSGSFGGQDEISYAEENAYLWSSTYVDECGEDSDVIDCSYTYVLRSSHFGVSVVEEYFDADVYYSVRCVKD